MTDSNGTPFFLVSGAGNDFIALLDRPIPPVETVKTWCRRGVSVGADGLFTLRRVTDGRYVLDYANADGAQADLCLNAARCAARLAFDQEPSASSVQIETAAGTLTAIPLDETRTAVLVPVPRPGSPMTLHTSSRAFPGRWVDVGVPHFVLWWQDDLDEAPVATLGPILRAHPDLGAEGANVHFVDLDRPGHFRIRSFERGVEAETLACGTGVVAAAACAIAEGNLLLPLVAATRSGCELHLASEPPEPDGAARWRLSGDARIVASGRIRETATPRVRSSRDPWSSAP